MAESQAWVPTVDDLRVKLCYICREEEHHNNPANPPVAWVHPCNCTLIAHEQCLLNWIQSAQQDAARKNKALKCPQCNAIYELESDNPLILKLLNQVNGTLTLAGKVVFTCGVVGGVFSCGFGLYVLLTSYGAHAVREFIGKEMYDILLSDDPSHWPWHAYFNLPLVPISLILARTGYVDKMPLIPLYFCWTTAAHHITHGQQGNLRLPLEAYPMQPLVTWPPSPVMVSLLLPFVTRTYQKGMERLRLWAMGIPPTQARRVRRIEVALAEGGPLNVQIAANFLHDGDHEEDEQAEGQPAANNDEAVPQQEGDQPPPDPAAAAAETVRITGSSLGRFIGGALLIPRIANFMGSVLYHLSQRSELLRKFLAIRKPLSSARPYYSPLDFALTGKQGVWGQFGLGVRVGLNILFGGTKTWAEADPVWWRNSIGLGVIILVKDCVKVLYLSLMKREIETRRVKNRSFAGIDLKELDLVRPSPSTSR